MSSLKEELCYVAGRYFNENTRDLLPFFRAQFPNMLNENLAFLFWHEEHHRLIAIYLIAHENKQYIQTDNFPLPECSLDDVLRWFIDFPTDHKELNQFYQHISLFKSESIFELLQTKKQMQDLEEKSDEYHQNFQDSMLAIFDDFAKLSQQYIKKHKLLEKIEKKVQDTFTLYDKDEIIELSENSYDMLLNDVKNHAFNIYEKLPEYEQIFIRLSRFDDDADWYPDQDYDLKKVMQYHTGNIDDIFDDIARAYISKIINEADE